jgi:hypothetical protein
VIGKKDTIQGLIKKTFSNGYLYCIRTTYSFVAETLQMYYHFPL